MPNNDLEVFDHLTSNQETQLEIDYLTYALFAWKKKQWVEHFASQHNARPTQAQIDEWITALPASEYVIMRNDAARAFDDAAQAYLAEQIEEEKKTAVDNSILAEIKQFTSPWKHFGIAIVMAIVAPVFLGGLIFLYTLFDNSVHLTISRQHETQPAKSSDP